MNRVYVSLASVPFVCLVQHPLHLNGAQLSLIRCVWNHGTELRHNACPANLFDRVLHAIKDKRPKRFVAFDPFQGFVRPAVLAIYSG